MTERSVFTVNFVRVRSAARDSKVNTRNPASCVNPVRMNCIYDTPFFAKLKRRSFVRECKDRVRGGRITHESAGIGYRIALDVGRARWPEAFLFVLIANQP